MNSRELRVDHFQFYDVPNRRVRRPLALKGLFDKGPVPGELTFLDMFANPVMKNGEEVYDRNAHLNMYYLYGSGEEPMRVVWAHNQYGEQKMYIGNPARLLVPTHKYEEGLYFPKELDHYKLYRVVETEPMVTEVKLEDQFDGREAKLSGPVAYAVPVEKEYRDRHYPIFREEVHLTIYRLSPHRLNREVRVRDQFGGYVVGPFSALLLAVPGLCEGWEEL